MLITKIQEEFKNAFKSGDKIKKDTLWNIKTKVLLLEKEGKKIDDWLVIVVISKELKSIKQTLEFDKWDDNIIMVNAKKEKEILEEYLPKQLTNNEVEVLVKEFINTNNLSKNDFWRIMWYFSKELKGKFDNKKLKDILDNIL